MVVHRPETVCHAQELGCYLQGQGHYKGLYNHNVTVSTLSMLYFPMVFLVVFCFVFSFLVFLNHTLLVDHHKPKRTLRMCYYCVKGQGHSNRSKLNLMFVRMVPSEPPKL